jgi:hypothetical protein
MYTRHYTASYSYVGGYYGGCSEAAMKKALVENGPLAVSFQVSYFDILYWFYLKNYLNLSQQNTTFLIETGKIGSRKSLFYKLKYIPVTKNSTVQYFTGRA